MVTTTRSEPHPSPAPEVGGPVWAVARRFPFQGSWDDADYFDLDGDFPRFELVDGQLVELPVPTELHQDLVDWLTRTLTDALGRRHAYSSGYKLRIRNRVPRRRNDYRYPDVIASADRAGFGPDMATAATLVIEVLSPGAENRDRDLREKRADYAEAGVPEYWVVDPDARTLLQLRLADGVYEEVGTFGVGETVASTAARGVSVSVTDLFDGVAGD